jgi:3-oxoacyl-[acyl-carrier-protein] synthase III
MSGLTRPTPVAGSRITGIGGYRPARIVTNAELVDAIDSSDEWIRERTGIQERRFARIDETVSDMAVHAGQAALADAGVDAAELDLVLVATATHPYQTPDASMGVAHRLGALNAGTFDVGAACSGFAYALTTASDAVLTGQAKKVLVIGSDKMTDYLDLTDRGTAFIFGDGAGAVVVEAADHVGIGPTVWGNTGELADAITMTHDWVSFRTAPEGTPYPSLVMQGQTVFRWALSGMVDVANEAVTQAGLELADLAAFVPHQANMRITDALVRGLHLPESVVVARDIITNGNTTAGTIPLALEKLREEGTYAKGGYALLLGFGAGLAYAGVVVELP